MRINDFITDKKLIAAKKKGGLLADLISLPAGFDSQKILIYWPSAYLKRPLTHKWLYPLLIEFQRNFAVQFKAMPIYDQAIYMEIEINGQIYPFAIDVFDKVAIDEICASDVMVYFKMQYATEGYSFKNVVPGGFIPAYSNIYLYLSQVREIRDRQTYLYDAYGRFGMGYNSFAQDVRRRAVEKLKSQNRFLYQGSIGRVSYKKSLFEVARSKVCIDLPGVGPFCFRLIDYLAVGACVIAYPHQARLPVPLTPGKEIIYCKEDLSDINDLCEYYINNDKEREAIVQASRSYFESYLRRPKLASYYINTILNFATCGKALVS